MTLAKNEQVYKKGHVTNEGKKRKPKMIRAKGSDKELKSEIGRERKLKRGMTWGMEG